jgi:hypothetical protein
MNEGKNFLNGKYLYLLHSIQNSFKKFKKFGFESDPYLCSLRQSKGMAFVSEQEKFRVPFRIQLLPAKNQHIREI